MVAIHSARLNHREDGDMTSAMQGTGISLQVVPTKEHIVVGKNLNNISRWGLGGYHDRWCLPRKVP